MKRSLISELIRWKDNPRRKPLILQGARQVGKTWLINQFAKENYKKYVYLNFEEQPQLIDLFSGSLSPKKLIKNIGFFLNIKITAESTLICFDEIQVCPQALTSLKYFQEQAPEFHLIAAGSLLGVKVGKSSSFPVGKVNFLTLYPMSFKEFLLAKKETLLVEQISQELMAFPELIYHKLLDYFKIYLYIGGMPEAVNEYIQNENMEEVRNIQKDIITSYLNDFSKYSSPAQAMKLLEVWNSVPFQVARKNKKFMYSTVKHKARASAYEQTITWLKNAGLIQIVYQVRNVKLPISGYMDYSKFKIYLLDTGLLGALLDLTSDTITHPSDFFKEYNGAFIENYVCLELIKTIGKEVYYWNSERQAEVDFLFQWKKEIIPLEVKSGTNRNMKSLRVFQQKFKIDKLYRTSPRNYVKTADFENIPLPLLFGFKNHLEKM